MAIQYPDTTTLIAFHGMVFAKSVLICLMSVSINSSQLSTLYHMTALKPDAHLLTSSYRGRFWFQMQTRGVHGNGDDWDPMGPMGFPWEWE